MRTALDERPSRATAPGTRSRPHRPASAPAAKVAARNHHMDNNNNNNSSNNNTTDHHGHTYTRPRTRVRAHAPRHRRSSHASHGSGAPPSPRPALPSPRYVGAPGVDGGNSTGAMATPVRAHAHAHAQPMSVMMDPHVVVASATLQTSHTPQQRRVATSPRATSPRAPPMGGGSTVAQQRRRNSLRSVSSRHTASEQELMVTTARDLKVRGRGG